MTVYAVQTFNVSTNATRYELMADIPVGEKRTALLFVHSTRAAANTALYGLTVAGWQPVGEPATATTDNRRYVAEVFALAEPAAGPLRVVVEATRPLVGLVAFLYLADNAEPGAAVMVAGAAEAMSVPGPFVGPVVVGVQARAGSRIESDTGEVLARAETQEADATTRVVAALVGAADVDAVALGAARGRLLLAVAVPLVVLPPPPPPPRHELNVIVRDLVNATHEVRWVRPGEIVNGPAGIDWDATPYESHVFGQPVG